MEISMAALMSIVALAIVVIISCINEDLNVGFLGIGFAIIVGSIWSGISGAKVMVESFPTSLFMILVGVTFFFGMAQTNGTMEKLTAYSIRLCKNNTALVPLIIYVLTSVITMIGPGNIAGTALMAPVAMAIASRVGLSAFLMTLLVVGASNGAAFSPFAPTGIISNGIIEKMGPSLGITDFNALAWKIHFNSMAAQGLVNVGGFFVLGGWAWMRQQKGTVLNIDELAPKPEPFNRNQIITLVMMVILMALVILPGLPATKAMFGPIAKALFANVGTIAFLLASVMMLVGAGDSEAAVKQVPWGVIMMVCGVSVLIDIIDKSGGLNALIKMLGAISNPITINGWLALITGAISAYSSSSGVVMPMFLPMVPGLIEEVHGGNPISLISSINVGAHLVDTSPLSTLGALCIACAGAHEDKGQLFRRLLFWGLSMALVGAVACYIFFGILNF